MLPSTPAAGCPSSTTGSVSLAEMWATHQGRQRCSFPPKRRERQSEEGGVGGRRSPAMRKAPSPACRGPCRKVWFARQPIHLRRSGSHPEGRGKGKFPTPPHRCKRGESAGDSPAALKAPSRSHPERAGSPWAPRCTSTRALGALCPATVAGRPAPL